jgi:hypothetical protein
MKPFTPDPYADIEPSNGHWAGDTWVFHLRTPKARKPYDCHACDERIEKGLLHVKYVTTNLEGPGFETWRLHGECYLSPGSLLNCEKRPDWRWVGPNG